MAHIEKNHTTTTYTEFYHIFILQEAKKLQFVLSWSYNKHSTKSIKPAQENLIVTII